MQQGVPAVARPVNTAAGEKKYPEQLSSEAALMFAFVL